MRFTLYACGHSGELVTLFYRALMITLHHLRLRRLLNAGVLVVTVWGLGRLQALSFKMIGCYNQVEFGPFKCFNRRKGF